MTDVTKATKRSRGGCTQCRKRHFRCDEARPECTQCTTRGVRCPGYVRELRWSSKHLHGNVNDVGKGSSTLRPNLTPTTSRPASSPTATYVSPEAGTCHPDRLGVTGDGDSSSVGSLIPAISPSHHNPGAHRDSIELGSPSRPSPQTSERQSSAERFVRPIHNDTIYDYHPVHSVRDESNSMRELWFDFTLGEGESRRSSLGAARLVNAAMHTSIVFPIPDRPHEQGSSQQLNMHDNEVTRVLPQLMNQVVTPDTESRMSATTVQDEVHNSHESRSVRPWRESTQCRLSDGIGGTRLPKQLIFSTASLLHHYDSVICRINSCFDSYKNPFRHFLSTPCFPSQLIYNCALNMSAAHLGSLNPEMKVVALDYQTQALSSLKTVVAGNESKSQTQDGFTPEGLQELVIAVIMIGMSSPWHDPSSLGVQHLHGARIFFRKWFAQAKNSTCSASSEAYSVDWGSFLVGAMAYWEMLSSFVVDQSLEDLEYLTAVTEFLSDGSDRMICPNPWTGVCTTLFVVLARLGCLMRHKRLVQQISHITNTTSVQRDLHENLVQKFRLIEQQLLHYRVPDVDAIEDTADPDTTKEILRTVAQVYQLTGLLELYTQVPELFDSNSKASDLIGSDSSEKPASTHDKQFELNHFGFRLAISILALISSISKSSRANLMLIVPLLSAGSWLQPLSSPVARNDDRMQFGRTPLIDSIVAIQSHRAVDDHWRQFVRDRIELIQQIVNLGSAQQAARLIEIVWELAEARSQPGSSQTGKSKYWLDVMIERRMETLLG